MTEQGDRHFATDPELVERYVLDRLDRTLRQEFDTHLRNCPDCRNAVEIEREIATGIRELARDDMKKRLARRVGASPPTGPIPWPRIVAVAAVLALVVGIGFIGNWFNWRTSGTGISPGEIAEERTPLTAKESSNEIAENRERNQKTMHPADRGEGGGGIEPAPARRAQAGEAESVPAAAEKPRTQIEQNAPMGSTAGKDVVATPAVPGRAAGNRPVPAVQQQYWATGTLTDETNEEAGAARANETTDKLRLEKKGEKPKGARSDRLSVSQQAPALQPIVLEQRPPSELPPAHQALHYQSGRGTIQSLIEDRADTLRVTLYPDPPIDRQALLRARAEWVRADSLVITLEGQQIGFHLPPELRQTRK